MQTQALGPGSQPFETSDGILAFSLYIAGVPFCDNDTPCWNEYDVELLNKLGFKGSGLEPSEAALKAVQQNKRGRISYLFQQTEDLQELVAAFSDQEKRLNSKEEKIEAREEIFKLLLSIASDTGEWDSAEKREKIIRLLCTLLKSRIHFMDMWAQVIPVLRVNSQGKIKKWREKTKDGRIVQVIQQPGTKWVSATASQETREHMKL